LYQFSLFIKKSRGNALDKTEKEVYNMYGFFAFISWAQNL